LLADLNRAKQSMLKKKEPEDNSPKLKILDKKDYIDYSRFENFHIY